MRRLGLLLFGLVLAVAALVNVPEAAAACEEPPCTTSLSCTAICGQPAPCVFFHGCRFCAC